MAVLAIAAVVVADEVAAAAKDVDDDLVEIRHFRDEALPITLVSRPLDADADADADADTAEAVAVKTGQP